MKEYIAYLAIGLLLFLSSRPGRKLLSALFEGVGGPAKLPYHTKFILTGPEYKFYMALKPLMDAHNLIICPKVGLKDLFEVNAGTPDRMKYFGKISHKHMDFLVCDESLRPVFAIELDDKSHRRSDVQERDAFKNRVFESAGFPLYRIPTNKSYSVDYLCQYLPCLAPQEQGSCATQDAEKGE